MRRLFIILLASVPALAGDLVVLRNQSEVVGRIVSDNGEQLVIDVDNPSGRLTVPYDDIDSINGLSAARLRSFRREMARAESELAARGVGLTRSLGRETRAQGTFVEQMMSAADRTAPEDARLAIALPALRLAPADWSASERLPALRAARRWAAYDASDSRLWLIVPETPDRETADALWIAAGRRPESYAVARESARAALDQMFDLSKRHSALPAWSDRRWATEAAWTGLASALALDILLEPQGLTAETGAAAIDLVDLAPAPRAEPEWFRAGRVLTEKEGARFCRLAKLAGGWPMALAIAEDPPASTEQILHPEKYFVERDDPTRVTLPCPAIPESAGPYGQAASLEMGEWMTAAALAPWIGSEAARRAAEGWDGDLLLVLTARDRAPALLWFSRWDTPADAAEFAAAEADAAVKRSDRGRRTTGENRILLDTSSGAGCIEWKGADVVVVESVASADGAARLAEAAWKGVSCESPVSAPAIRLDREKLAGLTGARDSWTAAWPGAAPKPEPLSGTCAKSVFTAPGAFEISLPEGWTAKTAPTSVAIAVPMGAAAGTVTLTWHRLPVAVPAALVFARTLPRDGSAVVAPYETKSADGRGWFQYFTRAADGSRIHSGLAVSGNRFVRFEAVAPPGGATDEAKTKLQEMLSSLRFLR